MSWKPNSPIPQHNPQRPPQDPWMQLYARLRLGLIALLPMIFVGCSAPQEPLDPSLPPAPGFSAVSVPPQKAGEPLLLICAREQAGRLENEAVIHSWERWYAGLQ